MRHNQALQDRIFGVLWPLQKWRGEEAECRAAANAVIEALKADIMWTIMALDVKITLEGGGGGGGGSGRLKI